MHSPISPSLAAPAPGASIQFECGAADATWEIIGPPGLVNVDLGQVVPKTGLYVAPSAISNDLRVTVRAKMPEGTIIGEAILQLIPPPLKVLPETVELAALQQQQFRVEPACYTRGPVWELSPSSAGLINAAGRYSAPWFVWAPRAVVVTATSGGSNGSATVRLSDVRVKVLVLAFYFILLSWLFLYLLFALWPFVTVLPRQTQVQILPKIATVLAGEQLPMRVRLVGTTNAPASSVAWSSTAGSISPEGRFTAPTNDPSASAIVTATLVAVPDQSDSATLWIFTNVGLSLHPEMVTLNEGQSVLFQARLQPAPGSTNPPALSNLVWSLSPKGAGSVSNSIYQTPMLVSAAQRVTVHLRHPADPFMEAAAVVRLNAPAPSWMRLLLPQLGLILLLGAAPSKPGFIAKD